MAVLMKVKSCCCGCSLELGTQIIFWLNVLAGISALGRNLFGVSSGTLASSPAISWTTVIEAIVAGIGLYGVANKRPQLLLPYLILSVITLVAIGLFIILLLVLAIFAGDAAKAIVQGASESSHSEYGLVNGHGYSSHSSSSDADAVAAGITVLIIMFLVTFAIIFALKYYFTTVVYSYYRHLKDEEARASAAISGPGYVVPPEQGGQPGYNYPPSYGQQPPPGYAPSYGQPAAVYPITETKN